MARRHHVLLVSLGLVLSIGLAACSQSASPAYPSSGGAASSQVGGTASVGLTGVVSNLNVDARTFSLVVRGGTRLIVTDADTTVWSRASDSQVRFSTLKDGQAVSVRGIDRTRYVLAKSIVISR